MNKIEFSPLASEKQISTESDRAAYFEGCAGSSLDKIHSFMRFVRRQDFAKLLAYAELFKMTEGVVGNIADCGVYFGQGMMTYAHLCASLEPYNYQCKVIGFDTFEGDTALSEKDAGQEAVDRNQFKYQANVFDDITRSIEIFDGDRPLNHLKKIVLVKGDLGVTAKEYVEENPEALFRIIHLSVNLYEPTLAALLAFGPRLSRGGIVAVHGLNYSALGAQRALTEAADTLGWDGMQVRNFAYYPNICYVQV